MRVISVAEPPSPLIGARDLRWKRRDFSRPCCLDNRFRRERTSAPVSHHQLGQRAARRRLTPSPPPPRRNHRICRWNGRLASDRPTRLARLPGHRRSLEVSESRAPAAPSESEHDPSSRDATVPTREMTSAAGRVEPVIEKTIIFMVAVSLPLMLVVEQIACWRRGLTRSDEPPGHGGRPTAATPWRSRSSSKGDPLGGRVPPTAGEVKTGRARRGTPHLTAVWGRCSIRRR